MNTQIRKSNAPFYGDNTFHHGISRSGFFNKRESDELLQYGNTFTALLDGSLAPENEEEIAFIDDITHNNTSELYTVKLWRKYLEAVEKSRVHHGFAKSNARTRESEGNNLTFA